MAVTYRLILSLFLGIFVLSGCSSTGSTNMLLPESNKPSAVDYLIGPGDQLQIFVWRNPDLSSTVTVRPDGKISSPLVKDLKVSGLRANDVGDLIEDTLSRYIRNPEVSIIVSGFHGTLGQQIRIIGNASEPQSIPYREGLTLLDVMIAAGGLAEYADGNNAKLIRNKGSESISYIVELDSLIRDGDISKNRLVQPGDTIIIPESWF